MIVSPDKSWCYLGPPKTGSTTLVDLLQKPPFYGVYSGVQHDMIPPDGTKTVFATVRSPWTRVLSLWKHRRVEILKPGEEDRLIVHRDKENDLPFDKYMSQVLNKELDDFFCRTLCDWLDDWAGNANCHIVKLENLQHGISQILPQYDWDKIVIPRLNDTDRVVYTNNPLFKRENRDLVRKWASQDFLRFDFYSWEI